MLAALLAGVLLVAAQRLFELRLSRRNERISRSLGAVERGRGHYPFMVALHSLWLVSTLAEGILRGPNLPSFWLLFLGIFLLVQPLRYWAIFSLGTAWNTKVLVVPGSRPVGSGPYRFIPHPNYVVVAVEILTFPLIFGAWVTALVFTALNAALLFVRIRAEDRALSELAGGKSRDVTAGRPARISGVGCCIRRELSVLDLKFIRENAAAVAENCKNRGVEADVDLVVELADRRSELIQELNDLRQHQNQLAKSVRDAPDAGAREKLIQESREVKENIPAQERELTGVEGRLRDEQLKIPNMTHPDSPIGKDDAENVEIRRWGEVPEFDFTPKDHVEIGETLGIIDFNAGAKVAGSKFYFLRGDAVLLELGLVRYALDILMEYGYEPTVTPDVARDEMLVGTGFIPRGPETQIYSVEDTDLSMIATAEITLAGSLANEILPDSELPVRLAGLSHCFRTEAGSHGRASRGLYRVHQFTKVEMFAFTTPEESDSVHQEMLSIEERIFQGLGLPYRVVDICTGDLGGAAYRKYDLEAWMPGRGETGSDGGSEAGSYGEVTSTSNTTDYQARRLAIRYRKSDSEGRPGGRPQLLHTLNGTALAISRVLIALLEVYQREDGSVALPEALYPYVGKKELKPV